MNSYSPFERSSNFIPIVGICGGSGSGKTTLCREFVNHSPYPVTLLGLDRYYRDLSHLTDFQRSKTNFDHPEALEIELLCEHLKQLRQGHVVECPEYDYVTHSRIGTSTVQPGRILLLEGIHVLTYENTLSLLDLKVFLDIPDDIRLLRRIRRDLKERQRTLDFVEHQYLHQTRPMHLQFIEPNKVNADLVLNGCDTVNVLVAQLNQAIADYVSIK